ncbi:MAG: RICIN domain-containing protein [Fibrobacterales bacterium]
MILIKHLKVSAVLSLLCAPLVLAGTYSGEYNIVSRKSGKVLYVSGNTIDNGENVKQHDLSDADRDIWTLVPIGNAAYTIKNKNSGKVLEVEGADTESGANVQQWDYLGAAHQQWNIEDVGDGFVKIISVHSGKALDVEGRSVKKWANVQQWRYWGGEHQQWKLDKIGGPVVETPQNFTVEEVTPQSISLSWSGIPGTQSYKIEYTIVGYLSRIIYVSGTETSLVIDGLESLSNLHFRIAVVNNAVTGPYSEKIYGTTAGDISNYNFYYGDLHNHSWYSVGDGTGSPWEAYSYARYSAGLDFFALADHSRSFGSEEWDEMKSIALDANDEGAFTAFHGFEWSSGTYGHVAVIGTDSKCSVKESATNTFTELTEWLDNTNGVAFLNHPGREDDKRSEFNHFGSAPSDKVVGMELFNKSKGFDVYYDNDGYFTQDNGLSYFDEANLMGWKLGAAGGGDHHQSSWGTETEFRIAALSHENSRDGLMDAFNGRRFYSTTDKDIELSFEINGRPMGSTQNEGFSRLTVQALDRNGEKFESAELYYNGERTMILSEDIHVVNHESYISGEAGFYYVKVTQKDGGSAISSPIYLSNGSKKVSLKVMSSKDDAEESPDGTVTITSTDLELVEDADNQVIGMRFKKLPMVQSAEITNAYLQFTTDEDNGRYTFLTIVGHDIGYASGFSETDNNITDRHRTDATVTWVPDSWNTIGEASAAQRSPDLTSIIQEIVNRSDWNKGNALALIIEGSGKRVADSFDGESNDETSTAPFLVIEYK